MKRRRRTPIWWLRIRARPWLEAGSGVVGTMLIVVSAFLYVTQGAARNSLLDPVPRVTPTPTLGAPDTASGVPAAAPTGATKRRAATPAGGDGGPTPDIRSGPTGSKSLVPEPGGIPPGTVGPTGVTPTAGITAVVTTGPSPPEPVTTVEPLPGHSISPVPTPPVPTPQVVPTSSTEVPSPTPAASA